MNGIADSLVRLDSIVGVPEYENPDVVVPRPAPRISHLYELAGDYFAPEPDSKRGVDSFGVRGLDRPLVGAAMPKSAPVKKPEEEKAELSGLVVEEVEAELFEEEIEVGALSAMEDESPAVYEATMPEVPEVKPKPKSSTKEFVDNLTDLLNSTPPYSKHRNVWVQSIKEQKGTRIPIHVVTFVYGLNQNQLGKIFIKDYSGRDASARRKDTIIPVYLSELGVPTAKVIGFNPEEKDFDHRFAFLQPLGDVVPMGVAGSDDFGALINDLHLAIIAKCSLRIVELMALMHVRGTENLSMLKSKYGLELEDTNYRTLIRERFLEHLALPKSRENIETLKRFMELYDYLRDYGKINNNFMQQADFTLNQIRIGESLDDYFLLDWELARKGALCVEDLSMYILCLLRAKPEMERMKVGFQLGSHYVDAFNHHSRKGEISYDRIELPMQIETMRGHLYKIGDQIWTQERFGESGDRKRKAEYHLRQFFALADGASKNMQQLSRELMSGVVGIVRESPKLAYLNNTLGEIERLYKLG